MKDPNASNPLPKRLYRPPQLKVLGSLEKLTKQIGTTTADGLTGTSLLPLDKRRARRRR
jgi:hypothetical protein